MMMFTQKVTVTSLMRLSLKDWYIMNKRMHTTTATTTTTTGRRGSTCKHHQGV
jgi:hypothetical protein